MILVCYGTRPEVIKLSPVIKELRHRGLPFKVVFTGQHRELYEDVSDLVPMPDYNLDIMKTNQALNDVVSGIIQGMDKILVEEKPDLIIVQGDTSTVLAASIAAFNRGVKVGHVEAGLRTHDLSSPFPEEANRQLVSRIASFNWAPTDLAAENLKNEGLENIYMTGNTVIDACLGFNFEVAYENKILITLHRRENFGEPMKSMFIQLEQLAEEHPELEFIFAMHPNPNVQSLRHLLKKVKVVAPFGYKEMVHLLSKVRFVISDSGGIQEECAAFGKKVLVCRNTSERMESVYAGFAKLVHVDIINNFDWANNDPHWSGVNPYGLGNASEKIVDSIEAHLYKQNNGQHYRMTT